MHSRHPTLTTGAAKPEDEPDYIGFAPVLRNYGTAIGVTLHSGCSLGLFEVCLAILATRGPSSQSSV